MKPLSVDAKVSYYDIGRTTIYASRMDQRFSYCCYVPEDYSEEGTERFKLFVAVHGTGRDFVPYRDTFADFAERERAIVLAPLFPAGITGPKELSSYKLLRAGDLHYDAVLLSMVDEIHERYRIDSDRFALFGFSGGGHFAHRFFYLHPERLGAISIGAPGTVTLLDFDHDFWPGVRNFEQVFGKPMNLDEMRRIPVQMVVGSDDTETWEITIEPGHRLWMPGARLATGTRQDRMRKLKASFEENGIPVRHDVVPGVAHSWRSVIHVVEDFLSDAFRTWRGQNALNANKEAAG